MKDNRAETIIIAPNGELYLDCDKTHDENYYKFLDYNKELGIKVDNFIPHILAERGYVVIDVAMDYNLCTCVLPILINDIQCEFMELFKEKLEDVNCHASITSFTDKGDWEHIQVKQDVEYQKILDFANENKVELKSDNKVLRKQNIA